MNAYGNDIDNSSKNSRGIKIVDNRMNKRISDIFNTRNEIAFESKNNYAENRIKASQIVEKALDRKIKVNFIFSLFLNLKKFT